MVVGAGLFALALGFVFFAESIVAATQPADPRAEGIVVLTGGTARIDGALQLLAEGRADRLLISGVNPAVTLGAISQGVDRSLRHVLECCVDLGREARDTIGNAAETRAWADERGFTTLIVVTSDYHMPRSMTELAQAMPGKRLIPFPVSNPGLHMARWWRDPETFSLLVREYGKFLWAETRGLLAASEPARAEDVAATVNGP
ncbi:MAG: YdcF family protein [Rhizobiales bacterium]|nr:YdcF family protein [Hyphomicrobiales bacterium]